MTGGSPKAESKEVRMGVSKHRLVIASTTSIEQSGLLNVLVPAYEKASPWQVSVEVIAVGTGKALRLAKRGDTDMLFVHDPFREEKFIAEGYGVNRRVVMHNYFVIVGPANDPAQVKKAKSASEALEDIAAAGVRFISRGDDSGTNIRELDLWDDAGINPKGKAWYIESGTKMGDTLLVADRETAYTLSDMGTFLSYQDRLKLKIVFAGDPFLRNDYSVIAVNPERFPDVRYREAMDFIAFVTSPEGQRIIASHVKKGVVLFNPDAVPSALLSKKSGSGAKK